MEDEKRKYFRKRAKWERYQAQRKRKKEKKKRKSGTMVATTARESEEDMTWKKLDNDPGQRANLDIDRFFRHYFLTDGKLDRAKTPDPLRLESVTTETRKEVIRRVKCHGLHFYHSPQNAGSILCVGVDKAKVNMIWDKVAAAAERTVIKNLESRCEEDMKEHLILAGQLCQEKVEEFGDSDPVWKLRDCSGLFLVRSQKIRQEYPRHLRNTLRISDRLVRTVKGLALVAKFDFGICSGTMYLADSSQTLQGLAEGDNRDIDAESDNEASANTSRKRKTPATKQGSDHRKKRRRSDMNEEQPSLSLLVSFRGRKNLVPDKEIFHIPRTGTIDFYDDYHCRLKGSVDLPEIGTVSFEGWKIKRGMKGVREPIPWHQFSESCFREEQKNKHPEQRQKQRELDQRRRDRELAEKQQRVGQQRHKKREDGQSPTKGTQERPVDLTLD